MDEALDFFDEVRVLDTEHTRELGVDGEVGVVIGMTEGGSPYVVYFRDREALSLDEEVLSPTGRQVDRSEIYDGTTIRVSERGEVLPPRDDDDPPPPA
jgi:Immunity protein 31